MTVPKRETFTMARELPEGYACWISDDGKTIQFTDPEGQVLYKGPLIPLREI